MKIAVIGSGIAAVSTIRALIRRGVKPVVLDYGEVLEVRRQEIVSRMSQSDPKSWSQEDSSVVFKNPTVHNKKSYPLKLSYGSDYFYGSSTEQAPIQSEGPSPPLSYALGGLSTGWAGSVLAPHVSDIKNWPVTLDALEPYFSEVLKKVPYSAKHDELAKTFPVYSDTNHAVRLTKGNERLLSDMKRAWNHGNDRLAFGNARLLVKVSQKNGYDDGCCYCGQCMSGCVYGYIYKASQDIKRWVSEDKIDYLSGVLVDSFSEKDDQVDIFYRTKEGNYKSDQFDRIFVGAGAVNSTRLVLKSKELYDYEVLLKSTAGFIAPMLRLKRLPVDWPVANTLPGLFLEYKSKYSDRWIHAQVSTPNEMVFENIGVEFPYKNWLQRFKHYASGHLVLALCNMHSDDANGYRISLKKELNGKADCLYSVREQRSESSIALESAIAQLTKLGRKLGCYVISPMVRKGANSASYHVGGSLPMCAHPEKETDTDLLGRPKGLQRVHIVDSSVFTSLPGTTIGLLAMANSMRIATEVELN